MHIALVEVQVCVHILRIGPPPTRCASCDATGDIKCNICATVTNPGEGDQTCRVCKKVLIGNAEGAGVGDGHGDGEGQGQDDGDRARMRMRCRI